jgi:hypothetical protein
MTLKLPIWQQRHADRVQQADGVYALSEVADLGIIRILAQTVLRRLEHAQRNRCHHRTW